MPILIGQPPKYTGRAALFGTVCSYVMVLRGSGYTVGSTPAVVFTNGGTRCCHCCCRSRWDDSGPQLHSGRRGLSRLSPRRSLPLRAALAQRRPSPSSTTSSPNTIDNIYQYDVIEAEAVYGDAALNPAIYGRLMRLIGGVAADDISYIDIAGNTRSTAQLTRPAVLEVGIGRIRATGTDCTHAELEVLY